MEGRGQGRRLPLDTRARGGGTDRSWCAIHPIPGGDPGRGRAPDPLRGMPPLQAQPGDLCPPPPLQLVRLHPIDRAPWSLGWSRRVPLHRPGRPAPPPHRRRPGRSRDLRPSVGGGAHLGSGAAQSPERRERAHPRAGAARARLSDRGQGGRRRMGGRHRLVASIAIVSSLPSGSAPTLPSTRRRRTSGAPSPRRSGAGRTSSWM